MPRWKCNACGGTYTDTDADGVIYFHACGPLPPDSKGVQAERPNKRDENIPRSTARTVREIRAAGAGVTPMDGQPDLEPKWIEVLRHPPDQP